MIKNCILCGNEFSTKNNRKIYCSKECSVKYSNKNNINVNKESKKCLQCNEDFKPKSLYRRFCSKECYKEWLILNNNKNIKECLECHTKIKTYNKKFCSKDCLTKWKKKDKTGNFKKCSHCKIEKTRDNFVINKRSSDGLSSWCKECSYKIDKRYFTYKCVDCGKYYHRIKHNSTEKESSKTNRCLKCAKEKIKRDNGGVDISYKGTENFAGQTFSAWESSARRRNIEWNISRKQIEEIYKKQNGFCALSGIKMQPHIKSLYRPSIDRIDSNKGYNVNNVHFVCSMVNMMKNKFEINNFIEMCINISKFKGSEK